MLLIHVPDKANKVFTQFKLDSAIFLFQSGVIFDSRKSWYTATVAYVSWLVGAYHWKNGASSAHAS